MSEKIHPSIMAALTGTRQSAILTIRIRVVREGIKRLEFDFIDDFAASMLKAAPKSTPTELRSYGRSGSAKATNASL